MSEEARFTQADLDAAIEKAVSPLKESIDKLETKNSEIVGENRKLRRGAEIKPEDLAAAEDRADKAEQALAEAQKQVKTLTTERDKAVKSLETETSFTTKLLIQDGIKTALITNGVKDEDFIDMLVAKHAPLATVKQDGDNRTGMIGDKAIPDYFKEWAGTDSAKKVIAAPLNSGGGAPGGNGGGGGGSNPFAKDSFNMTEQARLIKSDPARAQTLATEAGVSIDQAA